MSPGLIERVRSGDWSPETDERDREQRDVLAARGYWLAYQEVLKSLGRVLIPPSPDSVRDAMPLLFELLAGGHVNEPGFPTSGGHLNKRLPRAPADGIPANASTCHAYAGYAPLVKMV